MGLADPVLALFIAGLDFRPRRLQRRLPLAEVLKARGYATAAIGKWGLRFPGSEGDPLKQAFERFSAYNCQRHAHKHYAAWLGDDAEKITLGGNDGRVTGRTYSHDLFEREALTFVRAHRDGPFFP